MVKTSIPKLHSIKLKNPKNVVQFDGFTSLDIDPNSVLMGAINADMDEVVVLGYKKDGSEYFASNKADGADVLWHLQRAQKRLLEIGGD